MSDEGKTLMATESTSNAAVLDVEQGDLLKGGASQTDSDNVFGSVPQTSHLLGKVEREEDKPPNTGPEKPSLSLSSDQGTRTNLQPHFKHVSPVSRSSIASQGSGRLFGEGGYGDEPDHSSRPPSVAQSPQLSVRSVRSGSFGSSGSYRLGGHPRPISIHSKTELPDSRSQSKQSINEPKTPPSDGQSVVVQLSSGKMARLTHVSEDELLKARDLSETNPVVSRETLCPVTETEEENTRLKLNPYVVNKLEERFEDYQDQTFYPGLNPMYATVTSNVSGFSRESTDVNFVSNFPGGIIRFMQEGDSIFSQMDRFYVCVPRDSTVDEVANYIAGAWRKRTPKIVLSVISSAQYFKEWENERSVDNFKNGIIQAANLTEMWILTNGLDRGVTKMIGDAAYQEMARRKSRELDDQVIKNVNVLEKVTKLTVLGIIDKDQISYSHLLHGEHHEPQDIENVGFKPTSLKNDLNPNHTHFILGEDVTPQELINFRYNLELRFQLPVGRPRRYRRMPSSHSTLLAGNSEVDVAQGQLPMTVEGTSTPVIGLLVQGGPPDIEHVLDIIKKKVPVIVLQGFGRAADLVAFAYQEMKEGPDEEQLNMYIRPEMMKRVKATFPKEFKNDDLALRECRDKILEIAQMAHQDGLTYLTIVNTTSKESDLTNLSKYILIALFKAQTRKLGSRWREQIHRDLQLTLDWNRPDLAESEIFKKYSWIKIKIEDQVFHQALIRQGREEFVELFLKKGVLVHRYLHHKRLHNLFENAQDKEFFIGVCLEGVLGKSVDPYAPLDREFVETESCDLNSLLYRCTHLYKLVNPYTLSMNALGTYITNKDVAERRAVNTLVFWAALTNRPKLAKVFWQKTEDPMAVALIVSMLMHNLAHKWCKELDVRHKIRQTAIQFGKMAVSLLDLCYKDSSNHAFKALDKQLQDFNDRTVVEIARMGKNKWFIAHPCCQRWLSRKWYANLQIRELAWGHPKLPDWFKIYTSAFLIFPMFVWIYFEPKHKGKQQFEKEDDEEEVEIAEDAMLLRPLSMEIKTERKKSVFSKRFGQLIARGNLGVRLPVWKQIFYLWSAPITKFWINQLFYVFYLIVFSIAVLWPSCGDFYLNIAVLVWTATIWAELVRATVVKKRKYPEMPIFWKSIEIMLILLFLLMFVIFRITPHFVHYVDYMTTKFIMSIGLLLFYYRTLGVFLPMSPTLGPMLININQMVRRDFSTWMRMFLIVMVAGGITIHAVLYPNYPLTQEGIKKALARAFFAMFLTKIDDLEGDERCSYMYKNVSVGYCNGGSHIVESKTLSRCPYSSLGGYAIVIQYLIITKLILITLLFAMFSATTAKIMGEAEEIWKYQRYMIIVDFEERLRLPPPLSLISYVCMLLKFIGKQIRRLFNKCRNASKCCKKKDMKDEVKEIQILKVRRTVDFNYWKSCVKSHMKMEEAKEAAFEKNEEFSERFSLLVDEVKLQKENQRKLNDRVVLVEKNVTACRLLLEEMKHMIADLDPKSQGIQPVQQLLHISSRQSPYPGTRVQRFPVFDKYVSWEVVYSVYDPTHFTRSSTDFSNEVQSFVDPDIIELRREEEERQKMSPEELEKLPPLVEFQPFWNTMSIEEVDSQRIDVDRTSWMSHNDQPLRYKLDTTGLPQNPLGRTGIRGRGKLWRWGPNHRIAAVVTRWKRKYSPFGHVMDHIEVEGKKVLEFIVVPRPDTGELTLPGGNVYGKSTSYSVMCEEFSKGVLGETDVEGSQKFGEEDMLKFFGQFAFAPSLSVMYRNVQMNAAARGFSARVLYRGYIDDPSNTDNAWREAEVWNFHYELNHTFDEKIPEMVLEVGGAHLNATYACAPPSSKSSPQEDVWREVSPYTKLFGNQNSIVQEAVRIHDSYY